MGGDDKETGTVPTPDHHPDDGPAPAADLMTSPVFLLLGLGRIVRERVEQALAAHGMSLRLLSALGHLYRDPGISYSRLARRANLTTQSIQATVAHLEATGAVERRTAPGRGRTAELHVTAVGENLLRLSRGAIADVEKQLLAGVEGAERQRFGETLLAIAERAWRDRRSP